MFRLQIASTVTLINFHCHLYLFLSGTKTSVSLKGRYKMGESPQVMVFSKATGDLLLQNYSRAVGIWFCKWEARFFISHCIWGISSEVKNDKLFCVGVNNHHCMFGLCYQSPLNCPDGPEGNFLGMDGVTAPCPSSSSPCRDGYQRKGLKTSCALNIVFLAAIMLLRGFQPAGQRQTCSAQNKEQR